MKYPEAMVRPMRQEAIDAGCIELRTTEAVKEQLDDLSGTALVFINSICGCSAGTARPGLRQALKQGELKPDKVYTVFAGQDVDAVETVRSYFTGYPPSSPSMGLLKGGKIVDMISRHEIEGHSAEKVANRLLLAFKQYCQS